MVTKSVAISGTVGKQVYPTDGSHPVVLRGFMLSPLSAAGFIRVRSGNASGNVEFEYSVPANASQPVELPGRGLLFSTGMHVKVLGTGAVCYLFID